jgi:sigma-E factor negative regulatory protein RseB
MNAVMMFPPLTRRTASPCRPLTPVIRIGVVLKNAFLTFTASLFAIVFVSSIAAAGEPNDPSQTRSVSEWLTRMNNASSRRAYMGTFVVSSGVGNLAMSRIWHVCDGEQQLERVESLSGLPRTILRRNNEVMTFLPTVKLARSEQQAGGGIFPNLRGAGAGGLADGGIATIADHYGARLVGEDRSAGFDADVVQIEPKDKLRFGYRIWSEKKTGLVLKVQTLDTEGRVAEQSAFSELQFDAPVKLEKLAQMMSNTEGYRVEKSDAVPTSAAAEGWAMKLAVPGFKPVSCFRRGANDRPDKTVQWIFSDGLATVSLFLENLDRRRHVQSSVKTWGATQSLSVPVQDKSGEWWLTVLGEVPLQTLQAFAQSLERRP